MTGKKHVIWSNHSLDYADWKDDIEENYPELSEPERIEKMYDINNDYLDDERANLNVKLSRPIIAIADLGLWYGRRTGYKIIDSGKIADCLYSETDYTEWFVDEEGEMRCDAIHHDGTNHYRYRMFKEDADEEDIENLQEKLYNGRATEEDINAVTDRIGYYVGLVYGWNYPKPGTYCLEISFDGKSTECGMHERNVYGYESIEAAKAEFEKVFKEALAAHKMPDGEVFAEVTITKDGEFVDHDTVIAEYKNGNLIYR